MGFVSGGALAAAVSAAGGLGLIGGGYAEAEWLGHEFAAAGNQRNQNVPEKPSQGSVQSAVGSVIGAAKACVAGADDVSRAQVTFSSEGTVTSVSVTG